MLSQATSCQIKVLDAGSQYILYGHEDTGRTLAASDPGSEQCCAAGEACCGLSAVESECVAVEQLAARLCPAHSNCCGNSGVGAAAPTIESEPVCEALLQQRNGQPRAHMLVSGTHSFGCDTWALQLDPTPTDVMQATVACRDSASAVAPAAELGDGAPVATSAGVGDTSSAPLEREEPSVAARNRMTVVLGVLGLMLEGLLIAELW